MKFYSKWLDKPYLAVLLFGLLFRLVITFYISAEPVQGGDAYQYDQIALNINNGNGFSFSGESTALRGPLYPYFLAIIYKIFGYNYYIVRVIQCIIDILTMIIMYKIVIENFGRRRALFSIFILAFHPALVIYTSRILTETVFTFLLSLSFYFLLKSYKYLSTKDSILSGLIFGLCILTKPTPIGLLGFLFIPIIFLKDKYRRIKNQIIFTVISLLIVLPWTIRNINTMGELTLVSNSSFGHMMFIGTYIPWDLDFKGWDKPPLDKMLKGLNVTTDAKKVEKILVKESIKNIKNDPTGYLYLCMKKFKNLWFRTTKLDNGKFSNIFIYSLKLINIVVLLLFIIGIYATKNIKYSDLLLFSLFIYWSILHSITYSNYRYLVPILPFVFCYTSKGISFLINKYKPIMN